MEIDELVDGKIRKYEAYRTFDQDQLMDALTQLTGRQISYKLLDMFIEDCKQLKQSLPPKKGKVEVPKFVAEWIEHCRECSWDLRTAMDFSNMTQKMQKWFLDGRKKSELFGKAWIDGYTVKKEWVVAVQYEEAFSGTISFDKKRKGVSYTCDNQTSVKFTDKAKAEAVALLIGGEVIPVEEDK